MAYSIWWIRPWNNNYYYYRYFATASQWHRHSFSSSQRKTEVKANNDLPVGSIPSHRCRTDCGTKDKNKPSFESDIKKSILIYITQELSLHSCLALSAVFLSYRLLLTDSELRLHKALSLLTLTAKTFLDSGFKLLQRLNNWSTLLCALPLKLPKRIMQPSSSIILANVVDSDVQRWVTFPIWLNLVPQKAS